MTKLLSAKNRQLKTFRFVLMTHHTRLLRGVLRGVDSQVLSRKLRVEKNVWNFEAFFPLTPVTCFVTLQLDGQWCFVLFSPPTVDPIPIFALSSGDINFRFMKEQPQGLPLEALLAPSGVQKHHPWRDFCSRFDRLRCKNCLLTCFFRECAFLFAGLCKNIFSFSAIV